MEIDGGAASSAAPTNVPVEVVIFSLEKLLIHATTYLAEAADLRLRVAELMGVVEHRLSSLREAPQTDEQSRAALATAVAGLELYMARLQDNNSFVATVNACVKEMLPKIEKALKARGAETVAPQPQT